MTWSYPWTVFARWAYLYAPVIAIRRHAPNRHHPFTWAPRWDHWPKEDGADLNPTCNLHKLEPGARSSAQPSQVTDDPVTMSMKIKDFNFKPPSFVVVVMQHCYRNSWLILFPLFFLSHFFLISFQKYLSSDYVPRLMLGSGDTITVYRQSNFHDNPV